jgi:FkbM family methyltransferase
VRKDIVMTTYFVRKQDFHVTKLFQLMDRFFRELVGVYQIAGKRLFLKYLFAICKRINRVVDEKSLKPADDLMAGKKICLRHFDKQVAVDSKHFGLVREIYCSKIYFPPLSGFEIKDTDTVVDLGCNVGIFTVLSAKIARQVIALDAQSKFLDDLKGNLSQNNCLDKVKIQLALVGSRTGAFAEESLLRTASHYNDLPPKMSMEDICQLQKLDKIDFLKIDIEGSEFDLFLESNVWLEVVGRIAMEVHQKYGELNSIIRILQDWGFQIWLRDKNGIFVDDLKDSLGYLYAHRDFENKCCRSCQ